VAEQDLYVGTNVPLIFHFLRQILELVSKEDATNLLQILLSTIEKEKGKAWDCGRILRC